MNNSCTCLVKSKAVKQEGSHTYGDCSLVRWLQIKQEGGGRVPLVFKDGFLVDLLVNYISNLDRRFYLMQFLDPRPLKPYMPPISFKVLIFHLSKSTSTLFIYMWMQRQHSSMITPLFRTIGSPCSMQLLFALTTEATKETKYQQQGDKIRNFFENNVLLNFTD